MKEQKVFDISGISIGGQPGTYPTVIFGGLFFKGEPNFDDAKQKIQKILDIGKQTGTPTIPDFFIRKTEYIQPIISFINKVIPRNYPFSIDIIEPSIKVETLLYLAEKKLLSRTIYNSIHIGITKEESDA